ncbi:hypothetical protein Ddye_019375 [Dipteronia dyeriana]|uniref:Pectinesterase inhibitor domain-containing protein n=1 Tax=Dipteronia dyeriana TaxID=168575 RepID=A0AAD9TXS9_9ROSI|nr:hypothetical protein Ddye_019375 [Dipteronia dyeriana]
MVNPTSFYIPILILSIVLHILYVDHNTVTATSNSDKVPFIRQSCKATSVPDTCISVLEADSRSRNATDLKSLTRISIDIVYEEAIGLKLLFIKAEENVTDPVLERNVKLCIKSFDYCSYHIKTAAIPDFEEGNYRDANIDVDFCGGCANDCTDTGIKLFNREIATLYDFSGDVLAFLNMLRS